MSDLVRRANGTAAVARAYRTPLVIGVTGGLVAAWLLPFWLIVIAAVAGGYFYFKA